MERLRQFIFYRDATLNIPDKKSLYLVYMAVNDEVYNFEIKTERARSWERKYKYRFRTLSS